MAKQCTRRIRCLSSLIILMMGVCIAAVGAENAGGPSYRLRLEVVRSLPDPVIGKDTPGAESIPGGFEGGSSVKVMIDGKPEYHFFSHSYPKLDWSQSKLDHWVSSDGVNFRRVGVLLDNYRDEKAGMNHIFCAPIPFYDDKSECWYLVYCEFVGPSTWTGDSATIWCAESKTPGMKGISGPYDFSNRYVLVPKECPKIGTATPLATSCSAPFKVKDGRWAVLVSTDYFIKDEKSGARMQQWPVMLNFAASPLGPFEPPQEAVVPPLIAPTGFIENPMPLKVRGPKSGRDYWVTVFDFLAPEVTPYTPKNVFGFSWSGDGVHWPAENGQAVNIDNGLAAGERGWWRGPWSVRTPHRMIDEGDGTYTIYFTGGSADNHFSAFRAVGKVTVRLIEEETAAKPVDFAETAQTEMRSIPFADLASDGLLKDRAELAFRHLQEPYFHWDNVSRVNFEAFPGDAIGRTINGLTLLSQALHQPEPASLKEIMRRVPAVTNPDGYLGPKLPESRANEDVMAGHNGYACGLAEYALWTKAPADAESLKRMVANLFVPARAAIAGYRETSEAKVDWHLSGGDIGQLFLILDGMTRAYALVPSPEFRATIETAIERYRKLDLVGLSAQTHAMLSATTGILRWYDMQRRPGDLAFAEALYKQYRALAMTETFENYNWFNKPKWTEACAVSDSFILTVNLWRLTGRADYLEDAHLILFNGLLPGQLHNGGFGTGPCVGHATGACRTKLHSEAAFCCSMRGGEGIARAIQYSYFQDKETVVLPFYSNGKATLRFAEGICKVRQETGYPHKGQVRLEVLESLVNKEKTWRFFVPSWAMRDSYEIRVNGKKVAPRLADSFAEIKVPLVAGTVVEVVFQQERGPRPAVQAERAQGATRYFDGPLLLGSATENADEPLTPILDLFAAGGRGGEPYVYFPKQKSQPGVKAGTSGKVGNLAAGAQVFRRDRPADTLPVEVGKLFGALKHDRALAIIGFVWSKPQKVRQVILQWPESGTMPKPEEIALRWSDAGALHTAAQPGIIGNGRQWVYTLGTAPEGAVVDNLVLAGKSGEGIPDGLAVPDVEVIGEP